MTGDTYHTIFRPILGLRIDILPRYDVAHRVAWSLNSTGMERTRLLPAYGLADNAANAANGHVLARRVLLVIAATLALAAEFASD